MENVKKITRFELDRFNRVGGVIENQVYSLVVNGTERFFIGTADGRLSDLPILEGEVTGNLKDTKLTSFDKFSRGELIEILNQVIVNTGNVNNVSIGKADKCFVMAMAIAL